MSAVVSMIRCPGDYSTGTGNALYAIGRCVFLCIFLMFAFCSGFVLRLAVEVFVFKCRTLHMILKSLGAVTLVAAIILGLASCESSSDASKQREARKYTEIDDLNSGLEAAASHSVHEFASAEEVDGVEARVVESRARPKKFAKRSVQSAENKVRLTRQQQLQQQRNSRQNQKKQRPGFFWTLARVTFETFNDTRSAIQQIGQIINDAVPPEPARKPTKKPVPTKKPSQPSKTSSSLTAVNGTTTPAPPTTTTEAEFKLTRPLLQSLVRRNVKGLVRLFNIEWRDALNQSEKNVQEFRRDLGKQIGIYLQDNPDAY